jgi:hypothetical protein
MAARVALTQPDESSYWLPEQPLRKFGFGAMLAGGFPGGRIPAWAVALVTGAGWAAADRPRGVEVTGEAAEAEVPKADNTNTRGSTVSPAMVSSLRTWGHGRRTLFVPATAPFLDSKLIVFTKSTIGSPRAFIDGAEGKIVTSCESCGHSGRSNRGHGMWEYHSE